MVIDNLFGLLLIFYFRQIADIAKTTNRHQIAIGIGEGYNDDVLKTMSIVAAAIYY